MKRRRGNKKGRGKKPKLVVTNYVTSNATLITEDNSGLEEFDNEEADSGLVAEDETLPSPSPSPSPSGTNRPEKLASSDPVGRPINDTIPKAVYSRLKVRIKNSKNLVPQRHISDAPTQSDTDKSGQQVCSEKDSGQQVCSEKDSGQQVCSEKDSGHSERMEDSSNTLSETNGDVSANKSLGIKIKSSRGLGSSMSPCSNGELPKGDKMEKKIGESLQRESRYNEHELKLALEVIRKVMKMDAAEPFNAPVNPVALGIPDYYDVIDTPMDFGTICRNLEKGVKYKNSEDVLKDVQYIWDNCSKYNNKGDYIVELMKRVKKNFTKYWIAVGLFHDQAQENSGPQSNPLKDPTPSSEVDMPVSGGALILSGKKFHGLRKHKEGCQCAICVMMRRRQEREVIARMMGQTEGSDDSLDEDKPEGISQGGSPFGEYTSSNMENSPDANVDMEGKGQESKLGHVKKFYDKRNGDITTLGKREGSHDLLSGHRSTGDNATHYPAPSGGSLSNETHREMPNQNDGGSAAIDQHRPKGSLDKHQRAKMLENLRYLDNPMLLDLYGTLFASKPESFWNGPHSLISQRMISKSRSSLQSAVSSLMK